MDYIISIILVLMSAMFSGLTLGFFSLNVDDLKRKVELKDKEATKVYSVRKNGNLLLCTLLVGNVAVNTTLAIFLGSIASGVIAGLVATGLIVVFGEIIPQAAFSRYALQLGSKLVWIVKFFRFILFPICWPIAKILDKVLGEEMPTVYSKKELMHIITEHEGMKDSAVDADEERIVKGALSFSQKKVEDIMTPRTQVIMLKFDSKLDKITLNKIRESGHSRIPVYGETQDDILGIFYVKDAVGRNWEKIEVINKTRKNAIFVDEKKLLDDLLNSFCKTRQHLYVVLNEFNEFVGIVTVEDVIEEIIGEEIIDEYDKYEDLQARAKKKNIRKI